MDEKQGLPQSDPPPYISDISGHGNPSYCPTAPPPYPPQGQPGYPPQPQPGYPPQPQPGYPPQYPPQGDGGYPKTGQPAYPTGYNQQPMPVGAMQSTNNVTVVQTGGPMVVGAVFPPDYCGLAWFACLCCFWPLGICAILNSNNARDAINRGDLASASTYSQLARKYSYISIGIGIVLFILIIVLRVVVFASYYSSEYSYSN